MTDNGTVGSINYSISALYYFTIFIVSPVFETEVTGFFLTCAERTGLNLGLILEDTVAYIAVV